MLSPITRQALKGKVRFCDTLSNENDELIVWWYGGIVKNHKAKTVPLVIVFFRKLDENGNLGISVRRKVALTFLGLLRIGTIWKNGECKSEAFMPIAYEKKYADFTDGAWKFISPAQAAQTGNGNPIDQHDYPLHFAYDRNWLLDFPLENGKNLLIPCLEFLVRCYGRSEEVPRVLATYGWEEATKRFYAPFDQPVEPDTWPVKLKSRMYNGDIVCLAHIKHDEYAERVAKSINAQIEISFENRESYAFVQVAPWFQGEAQVLISGLWINKGKTFLALRVDGCSDPVDVPILRDRENTNKNTVPVGTELGQPEGGRPPRVLKKQPKIIDLTDEDEPDQGAPTVEVKEPDFVILGEPRIVIDVVRERAKKTTVHTIGEGLEPKSFSSGEPHGSGKGVGNASIHAPHVLESHGTLRDMWNAIRSLKDKNPKLIKSVEWFTFDHGFSSDAEPQIIALKPFDKAYKVTTEIRHWLYYDTYNKDPRGILVARLIVNEKPIYFIEIERRPRTKKISEGKYVESEDTFMGFVFVLDDQSQFESWLSNFLSDVRGVKGIVQKLVVRCPGKAAAFKHPRAKDGEVLCEAAVLNALDKVGISPKFVR